MRLAIVAVIVLHAAQSLVLIMAPILATAQLHGIGKKCLERPIV